MLNVWKSFTMKFPTWIPQGDKGEIGEQGAQGPMVSLFPNDLALFIHSVIIPKTCIMDIWTYLCVGHSFFLLYFRVIKVKRATKDPQTSLTSMGSFWMLSRWVILVNLRKTWLIETRFMVACINSIRHLSDCCCVALSKTEKLNMLPFLPDRRSTPSVFR